MTPAHRGLGLARQCLRVAVWLVALSIVWGPLSTVQAAQGSDSKRQPPPVALPPKANSAPTEPGKPAKPTGKPPAAVQSPAQPVVAASAPGKSPAAPVAVSAEAYAVRLRDLESRVDELKEQIRRSHTRLSLLSDSILAGGGGGARAHVVFKNELSGAFRLVRALFILDGAVQYNKQDDGGGLAEQKEIPIFQGTIPPGDHTLQVALKLRGHGYGVFSYLRGYEFDVKESHSFTVTDGKMLELDVVAWEKGGVTTPLEERPAIRHLERLKNVSGPIAPTGQVPATGQSAAEK